MAYPWPWLSILEPWSTPDHDCPSCSHGQLLFKKLGQGFSQHWWVWLCNHRFEFFGLTRLTGKSRQNVMLAPCKLAQCWHFPLARRCFALLARKQTITNGTGLGILHPNSQASWLLIWCSKCTHCDADLLTVLHFLPRRNLKEFCLAPSDCT